MTVAEVAEESRRTQNAIYILRIKGKGPRFRKIDGRLLCAREDFDAWMRGETSDSSSSAA